MRPPTDDRRSAGSWLSLTGHAIAETWADWRHDVRAAGSLWLRVSAAAGAIAAFVRILAAIVWSSESSSPFGSLGRDAQVAVRRLRRAPIFAVFSIVSLAIGIGGTTTIYSLLHTVGGQPPGVPNMDRLLTIVRPQFGSLNVLSIADFDDFVKEQRSFRRVDAWFSTRFALTTDSRAETSQGDIVTGGYFETLGITPQIGRLLQTADDQPSAPPALVIGDGAWRRLFDADPAIAGRSILVNGHPFTVVGVAPASFKGLFNNGLIPALAWIPMAQASAIDSRSVNEDPTRLVLSPLAILAANVSMASAQAETAGIAAQLDRTRPATTTVLNSNGEVSKRPVPRQWSVTPILSPLDRERVVKTLARVMMISVLLVLMVACTNLANLMLARAADRQRDIAVRSALGASRWRIAREAMVEAAVLAGVGGAASLLVARAFIVWLTRDVVIHGAGTVRFEPQLDGWVIAMALCATTVAVMVVGVVPAWRSSKTNAQAAIAGGGHSGALLRWRGRRILIVSQVAVSVMLVVLAALCAKHVAGASALDVGFDREHLALVEVDFDQQHLPQSRMHADAAAMIDRMARMPDVDGVTVTTGLPIGFETMRVNARAENVASAAVAQTAVISATPSMFRTIHLPVTRGRAFDDRDDAGAPPIAIVSEEVAAKLFGTLDVVGRTVVLGDAAGKGSSRPETRLIVGVARATGQQTRLGSSRGAVYVPLAQRYAGTLAFVAHATGDPEIVAGKMRAALAVVDPSLSVVDALSGVELGDSTLLFYRVVTWISSLLGGFAIVIALAGLYGVLAHLVSKRTREIGLRMALGAARVDVVRLVLFDGIRPVLIGLGVGLGIGEIFRHAAQPMFERLVPTMDVMVVVGVPIMLLAAGMLACYLPARRASRVDPNVALRES